MILMNREANEKNDDVCCGVVLRVPGQQRAQAKFKIQKRNISASGGNFAILEQKN